MIHGLNTNGWNTWATKAGFGGFILSTKVYSVNSVRKVVNLFSKLTVNHIRKRVENCQPKSGKDKNALHRCSVAVPKQNIWKSKINSIFIYKYRSIFMVWKCFSRTATLQRCNAATARAERSLFRLCRAPAASTKSTLQQREQSEQKKFDFYLRTAMAMSYLCVRFKNLTRASAALGIAR